MGAGGAAPGARGERGAGGRSPQPRLGAGAGTQPGAGAGRPGRGGRRVWDWGSGPGEGSGDPPEGRGRPGWAPPPFLGMSPRALLRSRHAGIGGVSGARSVGSRDPPQGFPGPRVSLSWKVPGLHRGARRLTLLPMLAGPWAPTVRSCCARPWEVAADSGLKGGTCLCDGEPTPILLLSTLPCLSLRLSLQEALREGNVSLLPSSTHCHHHLPRPLPPPPQYKYTHADLKLRRNREPPMWESPEVPGKDPQSLTTPKATGRGGKNNYS